MSKPKMTLQETITIVNNSGKIIKSGKQLYDIFKEARGNYQEKKAQIQSERALPAEPAPGLQRAHTFHPDQVAAGPSLPPRQHRQYYEDDDRYYYEQQQQRRRSHDDRSDTGSRRSRRSQSTHSRRQRDPHDRSRPSLTEGNLKTHSEVSTVRPSKPPNAYRSPYAETMPMDLALSRRDMTMTCGDLRSVAPSNYGPGAMMPRNKSETELALMQRKPRKEIDMNLAYGSIPPDLEYRTDLAPNPDREAMSLVRRVQGLLDEANCVQHSARDTMTQLQKDPDRAAAVALSLADLSNVVKKASPLVMTMLKGSPAVFSLLSSPHFLIGSSVVLGVTVVCFGGWKIVKRVREDREERAREALMYEAASMDRGMGMGMPMRPPTEYSHGVDEALILDDDLSSIETWRRGISTFGEDESADFELITPSADRAARAMKDDFDVQSRRSARTSKTHDSHRSHRSHRSSQSQSHGHGHSRSHSHSRRDDDDRRSRRAPESIADSERSDRSDRSHRSSRRRDREPVEEELPVRPKPQRTSSNMLKALFKSKDKERELVAA